MNPLWVRLKTSISVQYQGIRKTLPETNQKDKKSQKAMNESPFDFRFFTITTVNVPCPPNHPTSSVETVDHNRFCLLAK